MAGFEPASPPITGWRNIRYTTLIIGGAWSDSNRRLRV